MSDATKATPFKLHKAAITAGILMIVLSLIMMMHFPQKAELPGGFTSPIIAFEFARSASDVSYLSGDSPSSVNNRSGMRSGHSWDMIFPFAYAGFLVLLLLQRLKQKGLRIFSVTVCILIVAFDINENITLLQIVSAAESNGLAQTMFDTLYIATWLKWGAITAALGILASVYFNNRQWIMFVSALPYCLLSVTALILNSPAQTVEAMALTLSAYFLIAFVDQIKQGSL